MDILHDKRMVKSFMTSLAINAVGVCLIGGSPIYSAGHGAIQSPDTAATLHPVPITVATIPLTPLSETLPSASHKQVPSVEPSQVKANRVSRFPIVRKVRVAAKPKVEKAPATAPQMALATPKDFQVSRKQGTTASRRTANTLSGVQPTKPGLRGDVSDKLFERTLTGLEHEAANVHGPNATHEHGVPGEQHNGQLEAKAVGNDHAMMLAKNKEEKQPVKIARDIAAAKGNEASAGKGAALPPSPIRKVTAGEGKASTGSGADHGSDRYVGQTYKGGSPVNEQIRQAAAPNPGNDTGTAVHTLHLPKTDNAVHGVPGPKATISTPDATLNDDKKQLGFQLLPTDLGSTSIFGQVPWGKPRPPKYQDPNSGKDGMGLLGSYYLGIDFNQLVFQRPDSNINFIWTGGVPGPLMPPKEAFSVRWTGELIAPYTEPYTIMTASDDGVRVYLNGDLIIDNWTVHAVTEDTATVNLIANQPNDIRVEFYEKNGMSNEIIKLYWESKDTPLEYVPENALIYPQPN